MSVFFVGAMPWVQLFRDGGRTVWASVVQADWSPHGTGRFVMLRRQDRLQVLGTNRALAEWIWQWLLAPEEPGPVHREPFQPVDVDIEVDLDTGMAVRAGSIEITLAEPIDRQLLRRDNYPLGEFRPTASWVRVPCGRATVLIDGEPVPGEPRRAEDRYGASSTAQINVAEVWTT